MRLWNLCPQDFQFLPDKSPEQPGLNSESTLLSVFWSRQPPKYFWTSFIQLFCEPRKIPGSKMFTVKDHGLWKTSLLPLTWSRKRWQIVFKRTHFKFRRDFSHWWPELWSDPEVWQWWKKVQKMEIIRVWDSFPVRGWWVVGVYSLEKG